MSSNITRFRTCKAALVGVALSIAVSGCAPLAETRRPNAEAAERSGKASPTNALFSAIESRDAERVKSAIAAGADVNANVTWRNNTQISGTPLFWAVEQTEQQVTARLALAWAAKAEIVKLLLENGADANARDIFGSTVLMYAAQNNDTDTVLVLLEKGADVNAKSNVGKTALDFATEMGRTETAALLRAKMAK